MKYLSCLLVAVFSMYQTVGQDEKKSPKMELLNDRGGWSEGSILLADNTELNGMIKYNDREGILSYNNGDNTRAFGPRSVMGFEFFDEVQRRQRVFYTLDYESPKDNVRKPQFFEMLREYKKFAVLVKCDPIQTERRSPVMARPFDPLNAVNPGPASTANSKYTVVSQLETVYLMGTDGEIEAYFKNKLEQNGMRSIFTGEDDRIRSEVIDRDLLEKYTGAELYAKMASYAKENDLAFRTQDDLLKILDYHKEQLKK
jgi:hypothetical protein